MLRVGVVAWLALALGGVLACRGPAPPGMRDAAPVVAWTATPASAPVPTSVPASRPARNPLEPDPDWLFPVGSTAGCGFIDVKGKEVIPREHVPAGYACLTHGFPREGRFPVRVNGKVGYIDGRGRLVIPAIYDRGEAFSEGRAPVAKGTDWGYIDAEGRTVVPLGLIEAWPFSEGLAPIRAWAGGGKWGYVDSAGTMAIAPQFGEAWSFSDGLAVVRTSGGDAIIDRRGAVVVPPSRLKPWSPRGNFNGGLLEAQGFDTEDKRCGYVGRDGRPAFARRLGWLDCRSFSEGLAPFSRDDPVGRKFGYLDVTGRTVIEPRFHMALGFKGGLAPVQVDSGWGFIDRRGQVVIPARFAYAAPFDHGLALVFTPDGEAAYVDARGGRVWPPRAAVHGKRIRFERQLGMRQGWDWSREPLYLVVRDQEGLRQLWTGAGRDRGHEPPAIDLARHDVVVIASGAHGWMEITEVVQTADLIVVRYDDARPEGAPGTHWLDQPVGYDSERGFDLVTVPRQRLPYWFERRDLNATVARPRPAPR